MCPFEAKSGESLDIHFDSQHFVPQYICTTCQATFHTERVLKEHSKKHTYHHKVCDYCGFKAKSFHALDGQIESFHRIRGARTDRHQLNEESNRDSTDVPSGTNDDVSGNSRSRLSQELSPKVYSSDQLKKDPCRFWIQGSCIYSDTVCKFAHIKVCHYQDRCKSNRTSNFFHK